MRILITNDDGYQAKGLETLVKILRPLGELTVIAPKYHQSATSMAVTMGLRPIAVKTLCTEPETWIYVDGTPASCVKYGIDEVYKDSMPDIVVSGINHGGNYATAACYSGTLGAAMEASLAGIPGIGVSLDDMRADADFSVAEEYLPGILEKLLPNISKRFGIYYNINFPKVPCDEVKGIKIARQGIVHWEKEFEPFDEGLYERLGTTPARMGITALPEVEPGETVWYMKGICCDNENNVPEADHRYVKGGWITVTAHNLLTIDPEENARLKNMDIEDTFGL